MASPQARRPLGSRYELVERIGRGAMGEVWRIWDREGQRDLAAKLLLPHYGEDTEVVTRFVQERNILMGLAHPNIVVVHDLVVEGENLAIIMDLVDGGSLGAYRRSVGTLAPAVAVPVVATILDAVAYAHAKDVLHRDIKPDNVLLARPGPPQPEDVRLSDFGIARLAHERTVQATGFLGTPTYMPPEMFETGLIGAVSDVYAVGIVLYELLAGRTPFAGPGNEHTIGRRHLVAAPPPLPVDGGLWALVDAMLAKDPADRPTAVEAAVALRALPAETLASQPLAPQPTPSDWTESVSLRPRSRADRDTADPDATTVRAGNWAEPTTVRDDRVRRGRDGLDRSALDEGADDGHTRVRAAVQHQVKLTLPPTSEPATAGRRKWWLIGGGAVGVVIIALVILWATGVIGRGPSTAPPLEVTALPAHLTGEVLPTGLRIDLDASYDHTASATDLVATLTAPRATGLSGPVLLAIPAFDDGECPTVTSDDASVVPIRVSTDGVDLPCGWKIGEVALDPGRTSTVQFTVVGGTPTDFSQWLNAINQATAAGLDQVTGTGFLLQRIQGLRVVPQDVTQAEAGTIVPYQVYAEWGHGVAPTTADELFRQDTLAYQATDALRHLTGGVGLDGVKVLSCPQAQVNGIRVLADQPSDSCYIDVTIGELNSGQARFAIAMRGS
jgi:serine/threonine-protein kinase